MFEYIFAFYPPDSDLYLPFIVWACSLSAALTILQSYTPLSIPEDTYFADGEYHSLRCSL